MITYFQAIILGLLQGVTELFPISSLGHSILLPSLLGWNIDQSANSFLIFIVITHLATALVLFFFFLSDWIKIIQGIFRSLKNREIRHDDTYAKIGWLLVVATVPAGILGLLFQEKLQALFASARIIAFVLLLNGILLYVTELLRKNAPKKSVSYSDSELKKMSWWQAIKIGLFQCLALIPGFSRTGSTLSGGLSIRLSHEDAARFSFLLATPIIFAAAVLKIPDLAGGGNSVIIGQSIVGALFSACAAYFSVKFLTRYFTSKTLTPFALYCILAGFVSLVILFAR